jgi:NAD(P)-dependent dehydrogenase (short-subunit alcohol dehydrogenase family)
VNDLDRLFAPIKDERGKLDILFANAGIVKYAALGNISEELYDSIFNVNVKGVLFTVQKALPLMPEGASIILNASVVASKGLSSNGVYSATKAASRSFARTWTTDLKDRRIRVNAISPGCRPQKGSRAVKQPPSPGNICDAGRRTPTFSPRGSPLAACVGAQSLCWMGSGDWAPTQALFQSGQNHLLIQPVRSHAKNNPDAGLKPDWNPLD